MLAHRHGDVLPAKLLRRAQPHVPGDDDVLSTWIGVDEQRARVVECTVLVEAPLEVLQPAGRDRPRVAVRGTQVRDAYADRSATLARTRRCVTLCWVSEPGCGQGRRDRRGLHACRVHWTITRSAWSLSFVSEEWAVPRAPLSGKHSLQSHQVLDALDDYAVEFTLAVPTPVEPAIRGTRKVDTGVV